MVISDILKYIDEIAPFKYGESFDNNGLIVGDTNRQVSRILVVLDLTFNAIQKAIDENVDVIISHHPHIFEPIKVVTDPIIIKLIKNDIAYIAIHTNYDNGRLNEQFAKKLQLNDITKIHKGDNGGYFGGIGVLGKEIDTKDYINKLKVAFNIQYVKIVGKQKNTLKTIAYGNGSTSSFIEEVISLNCDVYITGEIKYHDEVKYVNNNCFVIVLGHFESEKLFIDDVSDMMINKFKNIKVVTYTQKIAKII